MIDKYLPGLKYREFALLKDMLTMRPTVHKPKTDCIHDMLLGLPLLTIYFPCDKMVLAVYFGEFG